MRHTANEADREGKRVGKLFFGGTCIFSMVVETGYLVRQLGLIGVPESTDFDLRNRFQSSERLPSSCFAWGLGRSTSAATERLAIECDFVTNKQSASESLFEANSWT